MTKMPVAAALWPIKQTKTKHSTGEDGEKLRSSRFTLVSQKRAKLLALSLSALKTYTSFPINFNTFVAEKHIQK